MRRRLLLFLAVSCLSLASGPAASGQTVSLGAVNGFCVQGGVAAITQGLKSFNDLQGIVPSCTVTVYLTGTQTLATISSDASGTALSNPFTANDAAGNAPGQWLFFASSTTGYDVVLSGGIPPKTYTLPVTLKDLLTTGSGGGGGGGGSLTNYIDVTQAPYGAACDGVTDDYAAFTSAVAAADAVGGTLFVPPGKTCAVSQTVIVDNCNLVATNAKLVPTGGSSPVDITPLQLGAKQGVIDPIYGLEPTGNHTYYLPDVYRPKPNPGWAGTTHAAVEVVSPNDNLYYVGRNTNFLIGTLISDYGISQFTPPYGFGGSYSTFFQGWMENNKLGIVEAAQCNQCYINQINWIGGRANLNTSERTLPSGSFYGVLQGKNSWTSGTLPNVIQQVTATSTGGGFPSGLATSQEVVGALTGYPAPTLPDQAYISSLNSGASTVTLSFNMQGFITSGSNIVTGLYNTKDMVGSTPGTLISIPFVPINATYSVSGGTVSMSGNSQGTTLAGTLNHFTFYNNQTVIAKATGTLTAGNEVISNLTFTSGNLAALGTGSLTSYVTSYDAFAVPNGASVTTTPTSATLTSSQPATSNCSSCQAQFVNGTVALSNSAAFTGLPTIYTVNTTAGSSTVTIINSAISGNSWDGILGTTNSGLASLVTGTGIPSSTNVLFVIDTHTVQLTNNATTTSPSGGTTLTFPAYANFNSSDLPGFTNTEFVVPVTGSAAISQLFYPDPISFSNNNSFFQGISVEGEYWDYMIDCLGCSRNRYTQNRYEGDTARVRFRDYVPVTNGLPTWSNTTTYTYGQQVAYLGSYYENYLVSNVGNTPSPTATGWATIAPQYPAYENDVDLGFYANFLQVIDGPASSSNNLHTSQSLVDQLAKASGNVISNQTGDNQPIWTMLSGQTSPYDQNLATAWTGHIGSRYWEGKAATDTQLRLRLDMQAGGIFFGDGKTAVTSGTGNFGGYTEATGTPDAGAIDALYSNGNLGMQNCVLALTTSPYTPLAGCSSNLGYNYSHLIFGSTHVWYDTVAGAMKESTGAPSATTPGFYLPTAAGTTPTVITPGYGLGGSALWLQGYPITTSAAVTSGSIFGQGLIYESDGQLEWDTPWARASNIATYLTSGTPYGAALVLTAAGTASGGNTTYTGTITGGASNAYAGKYFTIAGFTNTGNNIIAALVSSSSTTTITLANSGGVAETHAGSATITYPPATNCNTATWLYSPHDNACYAPGSGGGSSISINSNTSTALQLNFSTGAGSCSFSGGTTTCTFTGSGSGGGSVTTFTAPSGSWPTWLVPTVTNASTTPNLAVAASAIPNSALANSVITLGSTSLTLGGTVTSVTGLTVNGVSLSAAGSSTQYLNGVGGYATPASEFPITIGSTSIAKLSTTTSIAGLTLTGATLTTSTVNGVTLSNANATTTYLNGAGAYTTPAGAGTVTAFTAPSGSWPTWCVPTVTNSTTTPSLAVACANIPNSALANPSLTLGSTSLTLGATTAAVTGLSVNGVTLSTTAGSTTYLNGAGSYVTPSFTQTICSGTVTLGTASIPSGSAATTITATCTGLASTDDIQADFNGSPLGIVGYQPSTGGMLTIIKWPSSNTVNFAVVNNTQSAVSPGSVTLNYRVTR